MYVYIYVCTYVCTYYIDNTHTHTHTHTHAHTHTHTHTHISPKHVFTSAVGAVKSEEEQNSDNYVSPLESPVNVELRKIQSVPPKPTSVPQKVHSARSVPAGKVSGSNAMFARRAGGGEGGVGEEAGEGKEIGGRGKVVGTSAATSQGDSHVPALGTPYLCHPPTHPPTHPHSFLASHNLCLSHSLSVRVCVCMQV
jgi:hypothetical protein